MLYLENEVLTCNNKSLHNSTLRKKITKRKQIINCICIPFKHTNIYMHKIETKLSIYNTGNIMFWRLSKKYAQMSMTGQSRLLIWNVQGYFSFNWKVLILQHGYFILEKLFIAGRIHKISNKLSKEQEKNKARRLRNPFVYEFVNPLYYQQRKEF